MAVINTNDAEFKSELTNNSLVVIKYFADWCGSCKLIAPKYRRLSDDARFSTIRFLEVDAEVNEEVRKTANVDNLPYFAIFKDGALVAGSATSKEEKIVELLEKLS
jgi:thioredoxin 1